MTMGKRTYWNWGSARSWSRNRTFSVGPRLCGSGNRLGTYSSQSWSREYFQTQAMGAYSYLRR